MTTPPLDLTALRAKLRITKVTDNAEVLALLDRVEESDGLLARLSASGGRNIDLLDRLEAAERDLAAVTVSRDGWQTRAEAAEAAVARVEAICQDTDGNWLDPEDECNNVGSILQAVRGEHTKQLGGTPTGEFADVCSCGKSYWPCDSLDGEV